MVKLTLLINERRIYMINQKRTWKRCFMVGLAATVLLTGLGFTEMQIVQAKATVQGFDIVAHRGGRAARAENTLYAFAYAMETGVSTIELDIQLTKDGKLVVSHNAFLHQELVKGQDGAFVEDNVYDIRTMTLDELRQFDIGTMNPDAEKYYADFGVTQVPTPGAKIPTLEEVFDLINSYGDKKVVVNIELKSYADPQSAEYANNPDPKIVVKKIYDVIKNYHMEDRVVFQSFDWKPVKIMKNLDPNITVAALSYKKSLKPDAKEPSPWLAGLNINNFSGNYVKAVKALGADMSTPEYKEVTPELIAEAHALGLKLIPWTVNNAEDMAKLIDMGVDGIITDKPWVLREVLTQRGIPVPEPVVNVSSPYHTGTDIRQ